MIIFGNPLLGEAEIDEVVDCMRSGWIGTGPKVAHFESMFREYVGADHAVAVNSCTAALHLSLIVSGVGVGDEVITTPMTFCATSNAIIHTGAKPVFVDVDPLTMNMAPDQIEAAITPRTRAILPVHFAGRACDMGQIAEIAKKHGLIVIEDAAHCIEGWSNGRKIGTISPLTCFSFYVTKNITTGEGGMVTTNDSELAAKVKMYGLHGMSADAWARFSDKGYKHYQVIYPGFKYNMTDMQAALGVHQLPRIETQLLRRNAIWRRYDEAFADLPISLPYPSNSKDVHARHLYTVLIEKKKCGLLRDEMIKRLHDIGIGTGVHYTALHLHPYYMERFGYKHGDFPNAEKIGEGTLSLPLSAKLTDDNVETVIRGMRSLLT